MEWVEVAALVGAATGIGSLIVTTTSVIVNARQGRRMEQLVSSQVKIVQSLEREAQRRRRENPLQAGSDSLRREALELKKREAEWKRTKDILRGLKWFAENVEA